MAGLGRKSMNKAGLPCFIGANVVRGIGTVHEPETKPQFPGKIVARRFLLAKLDSMSNRLAGSVWRTL
jgi:hypothetical protein